MVFVELDNQERDQISKNERCEMRNDTTSSSHGFSNERDTITWPAGGRTDSAGADLER